MKYEKPAVAVADALKAVQSGVKPSTFQMDSAAPYLAMTNGAYEADE